jgi:hypothetical protein
MPAKLISARTGTSSLRRFDAAEVGPGPMRHRPQKPKFPQAAETPSKVELNHTICFNVRRQGMAA